MTLKVIEIVGITYRTATNLSCGCEDFAAIPVPYDKSDHQNNVDRSHDMVTEPEALELVVVEQINGKTPRVTLLDPETHRSRGSYSYFSS